MTRVDFPLDPTRPYTPFKALMSKARRRAFIKLLQPMNKLTACGRIKPVGSQRATENKERACCNQNKADGVIPGDRLLEIENGEACEHQQCDDLLNGLELGSRIDRA